MPRLLTVLRAPALAALLLFAAGCDSAGVDASDAEVFVGAWTVTRVADAEGDRTDEFEALGTLTATFAENGAFTLTFDPVAGEEGSVSGTYTLQEDVDTIILRVEIEGISASIPAGYDVRNEDLIDLTIEEIYTAIFAAILGDDAPDFSGAVDLTLERD